MNKSASGRAKQPVWTAATIRQLRQRLAWTQVRLSGVLQVHRSTVSRWECGHQRPSNARVRRLDILALTSAPIKRLPARASVPAVSKVATVRQSARADLLARLNGRRVIASVSGGKDSAALSLHLRELDIDHDRVFLDTGWESEITYEYLRGELSQALGPITWVKGPQSMEELIRHKLMFPSRHIRYCTQELKVLPMERYLRQRVDAGEDVLNAVGIRRQESPARARMTEWEWQHGWDVEVWRPLIAWTEAEVIAIHARHGLKPNPLYLLGARRVGCWPCIFARKSEIRLIADTDPKRIVRLRVLESEVALAARARAEREGRELKNNPAMFQNPTSRPGPDGHRDGSCWPIDRVVDWSRSAPRGPMLSQDEFLFTSQRDGCARWGLCDAGEPVPTAAVSAL